MQSKLSMLITILDRMESLYARVHELLQAERDALVQLDYERIYQLLVEKDEIIAVVRSLDGERLKLQDQLSIMLDVAGSDVNLRDIAHHVEKRFPELSIRLMDLRTRVNHAIAKVVERIGVNRGLIEKSVKNLQDIAKNYSRALSGKSEATSPSHGTYDGKAKYSGPKQGSGSLVRKQL